ncbi:MAG: transposase [Candidatus Omnitrophota bacterium]
MYSVGCDQHKKYSFVVSKDQGGNTIDQLKLYHADKDSMKDYFKALPEGSKVALEASGFSFWLADMLQELAMDVKLVHAAKAKAIAEEKIKTDKMSAGVLADLLRVNMLPEAYIAPRPIRQARALLRYRQNLIGVRTSLKNRIHSVIDQQGIQQGFSDLFTRKGRQFIDQLELGEPYQSVVGNYLSLIDDINTRINEVEAQLRRQLKKDKQAQLLTSIPGVGVIISHLILAESSIKVQ